MVSLSISENKFNGSINSIHWENLINLEFVDLSYNLFNGGIPLSMFSLPLLELVALSNNKFSHQFYEFSNVSSYRLGALDLSFNNLEGPIHKFLFNLRGLEILYFLQTTSNNIKHKNKIFSHVRVYIYIYLMVYHPEHTKISQK
ncbi:hypothetical protein ACE6H2_004170 [Prunus campanulata]